MQYTYRISTYGAEFNKIRKLEVISRSLHTVNFREPNLGGLEVKESKNTRYHRHFDSFDKVKSFLVSTRRRNHAIAIESVTRIARVLKDAEELTEASVCQ